MLLQSYKKVYSQVMGKLFPEKMVYAKKYEALMVRKQFQPVFLFDPAILSTHPEYQIEQQKLLKSLSDNRKIFGITSVITDDRIPKTGLYTIDKRQIEKRGVQYTEESIINALFASIFATLGDSSLPGEE